MKKPISSLILISLTLLSTSQFFGGVYGLSAPEFTVTDIDGNTFSLSAFRGKVVLVEFFTTWCSTCKEEIPDLKTIYSNFNEQQLIMISLSHDDDNPELIDYRNNYQLTWTVAACSVDLYDKYGVWAVPTLFVVSPEGEIVYTHTGSFNPSVIIAKIDEQLITEPPIITDPEPSTDPNPEPINPNPDTELPVISILSPVNRTYSMKLCTTGDCTAAVPLTLSVSEPTIWIGYKVDNRSLETISRNTTIMGLLDGEHSLVVYAVDTFGNNGSSNIIHFTIDTTPPLLKEVIQSSLKNNVTSEDEIVFNVTVVDTLSKVNQVTFNYTHCDLPWVAFNMSHVEENIWSIGIASFPYCDNSTYIITMEDTAGNVRTTEALEFKIESETIPEFQTLFVPILFTITTLLVFILKKELAKSV